MGEVFKLNHCYNMDCLPAMELFPDNYFDLAVVDPPYFSGPERRGFYGSKVSKIGVHRDYPVSPAWSKPEPEYFRELFRVCRHYIVWGCNYFDYGSMNAEDLRSIMDEGYEKFCEYVERYEREKRRTQYGT